MYHFILDPLRESEVCSSVESFVVILKKRGQSVEINEKLGSLVIVLHDELFQLYLSIGYHVLWTEVD